METNLDLLIDIVDGFTIILCSHGNTHFISNVSQLASFSSPFHCKLNIELKGC